MVDRIEAQRLLANHDFIVTQYAWACRSEIPVDCAAIENQLRQAYTELYVALTGAQPSQDDLDSLTA